MQIYHCGRSEKDHDRSVKRLREALLQIVGGLLFPESE